ncbi:hypothetical protein IAT38_005907 [Cryptococcus sp. DSM 104549]
MSRPLPQLTPPPPDAPAPDPAAVALEELIVTVRAWTEWVTNSDPSTFVDYPVYQQFKEWVKTKEALDVIDGILQARLKLGFPHNQKALMLVQLIPDARLAPYAPLLLPLTTPPDDAVNPNTPFITSLASALHTAAAAEAAKIEAAKKAEEEKKKAEEEAANIAAMYELYGRGYPGAPAGFAPLGPGYMGMGMPMGLPMASPGAALAWNPPQGEGYTTPYTGLGGPGPWGYVQWEPVSAEEWWKPRPKETKA